AVDSAATAATRDMPSAGAPTPTTPIEETRRRSPWMWPLIAIVSLLAVALIAIIIVFAVQPRGGDDPSTPPSTPPSKTPSDTPSASPTSDTVTINRTDYIGLSVDDAIQKLTDTGGEFQINQEDGSSAPSPDKANTVQNITPTGNVRKGQTITLTVYGAFPPPSSPGALNPFSTSGDPGDPITLTFAKYTGCPAGYALEGYTFTLDNASAVGGSNDIGADKTSFDIQLGTTGTAKASYVARCANGITSQASPQVSITVN
ncbi:MAG: PASTA domain-containing protein, partial [Protaetiibacter sp.]